MHLCCVNSAVRKSVHRLRETCWSRLHSCDFLYETPGSSDRIPHFVKLPTLCAFCLLLALCLSPYFWNHSLQKQFLVTAESLHIRISRLVSRWLNASHVLHGAQNIPMDSWMVNWSMGVELDIGFRLQSWFQHRLHSNVGTAQGTEIGDPPTTDKSGDSLVSSVVILCDHLGSSMII